MNSISALDLIDLKRGTRVKVSTGAVRSIVSLDIRGDDYYRFEVDYAALTTDNQIYIVSSMGKCFYLPASQHLIQE